MRSLDLTKVNKEIWDGCPLLPRGPPDTSTTQQAPTPCDLTSALSDSSEELTGSGFNSSGASANQPRRSRRSEVTDDEGSGHSTELFVTFARDSLFEDPHCEAFARMESQSSRIPLPDGTVPSQQKTPDPLHDAPRDWASFLRQDGPTDSKPTGIPRLQGKTPRKPRDWPQPKTRITKAGRNRRLRSPQASAKSSLPRYPTNLPKLNGIPSCIPAPVPRLNLAHAAAHDRDYDNLQTYGDSAPRTSFDDDSTCAYSADELSQVSSAPPSEMPSEIPSEILAEMASELPSEIPLMESKRTPRSVAIAKIMAMDQETNYGDSDEEEQAPNDQEQNGVLEDDGIGSPYLQGMGYTGSNLNGSMHVFRGSEGNGSPYLQGIGCSEGDSGSIANDFDGSEGVGVEEEGAMQLGEESSDEEHWSKNQWEWSDDDPQPSENDYGDHSDEEVTEEFNEQGFMDGIDDWRKKRLQYAEQTSDEEGEEESGEEQDLDQQRRFKDQECGEDDDGSFYEKESEESPALWENSSRLSNTAMHTPNSLRDSFNQDTEGSVAGMQKSPALQVSIDLSKGVSALVAGSPLPVGVLPLEAPFQTKNDGKQDESGVSLKNATFVEAEVNPCEPIPEKKLTSAPVDEIFESHSEVHATPGLTEGEGGGLLTPVFAAQNDIFEKGYLSDGDLSSGKAPISKRKDCKEVKWGLDGLEPPSNDANENECKGERTIAENTAVLQELTERKQLGEASEKRAESLEDKGLSLEKVAGQFDEATTADGCEIDSVGAHPSSTVKEVVEADPDNEKDGQEVVLEHQEPVEKETRVDKAVAKGTSWRYFAMHAVCAGLLATMIFLWWSVMTSAFFESNIRPDLSTSLQLLPLHQELNFSSPNILDTSTVDTTDDTQDDADEIDGSELGDDENGEGGSVSNSFSLTIENNLMKLGGIWPNMLWVFVPRSFLGWVKFLEWIFGGLVIFWLLLF